MKPIIEIQNLGKEYTLRHDASYGTLRDSIMNFAKHPFNKISHEKFWALKDINVSINAGEVVGIIGRNGAGKSTLLKILSGITRPTTGRAILRGKTSSLLEVGTGFHPELTGRENIYLNGSILGMNRKEVAQKFDQIVDFAGVSKFLDTPVKHYSSGMHLRLGFSVAAHLEPQILIVDEVLTVGDFEFQKKCLGKMQEVSQQQGRTILFVSHNLSAIAKLCSRTVLLTSGHIDIFGETHHVLDTYLNSQNSYKSLVTDPDTAHVANICVMNASGATVSTVDNLGEYTIRIQISSPIHDPQLIFAFTIFNNEQEGIFSSLTTDSSLVVDEGLSTFEIKLPSEFLNSGQYRIEGALMKNGNALQHSDNFLTFQCTRSQEMDFEKIRGLLRIPYPWKQL